MSEALAMREAPVGGVSSSASPRPANATSRKLARKRAKASQSPAGDDCLFFEWFTGDDKHVGFLDKLDDLAACIAAATTAEEKAGLSKRFAEEWGPKLNFKLQSVRSAPLPLNRALPGAPPSPANPCTPKLSSQAWRDTHMFDFLEYGFGEEPQWPARENDLLSACESGNKEMVKYARRAFECFEDHFLLMQPEPDAEEEGEV